MADGKMTMGAHLADNWLWCDAALPGAEMKNSLNSSYYHIWFSPIWCERFNHSIITIQNTQWQKYTTSQNLGARGIASGKTNKQLLRAWGKMRPQRSVYVYIRIYFILFYFTWLPNSTNFLRFLCMSIIVHGIITKSLMCGAPKFPLPRVPSFSAMFTCTAEQNSTCMGSILLSTKAG